MPVFRSTEWEEAGSSHGWTSSRTSGSPSGLRTRKIPSMRLLQHVLAKKQHPHKGLILHGLCHVFALPEVAYIVRCVMNLRPCKG